MNWKKSGTGARTVFALMTLVLLGIAACKKTDHYYGQLADTPEIYTRLGLDYSRLSNGITRQYHTGDTLKINGRFNAKVADVTVHIGGVTAPVIGISRQDSVTQADKVAYYRTVETISVVLADSMGTGRLPLEVHCRGFAIDGPLLYLLPKGSLPPITDTLVWKQLLNFKTYSNVTSDPAMIDSFFANPVFYPSFSGTGNVFFSQKSKIQLLRPDGSIEPVIDLKGASDAKGEFGIVKMYNGAVDQQERYLYFSALTTDQYKTPGTPGTATDADSNWIFRYCRLNLQTGELQVINRTLFPFYKSKVDAMGTAAQLQTLFTGEGPASEVNMMPFAKVWADNAGDVYFIPAGISTGTFDFNNATGRASYYPVLYNSSFVATWYSFLGKITPDGQVHYLFKNRLDWPGDGLIKSYVLALDPVKGLLYTGPNVSGKVEMIVYDLHIGSVVTELHPTVPGAGATGPFNLLDPMTPAIGGAINYGGLGGDLGPYMPLPGNSTGFLYDLQNVAYDFTASQAYLYGPAMVDSVRYLAPEGASYDPFVGNRQDLPSATLNFDSEGNIYKVTPFYIRYGANFSFYYDVRRTYILKH